MSSIRNYIFIGGKLALKKGLEEEAEHFFKEALGNGSWLSRSCDHFIKVVHA